MKSFSIVDFIHSSPGGASEIRGTDAPPGLLCYYY